MSVHGRVSREMESTRRASELFCAQEASVSAGADVAPDSLQFQACWHSVCFSGGYKNHNKTRTYGVSNSHTMGQTMMMMMTSVVRWLQPNAARVGNGRSTATIDTTINPFPRWMLLRIIGSPFLTWTFPTAKQPHCPAAT